jgi:hypothetical protein
VAEYGVNALRGESTITLGPWVKGINNRQPDYALPKDTLRDAINTDLDNLGHASRRQGFTKVVAAANTRAGYSCPLGEYFIQGAQLCRFNADDSVTVLANNITGEYATYCYANDAVYFSDGIVTHRITATGVEPWGQDVPNTPLLDITSGSLSEGCYMVAVTTLDDQNRESGASEVATYTLNATGGLRVFNLPTVKRARIYASMANGTTLYLVGETAAGQTSYNITAFRHDAGKPLDFQFLSKPPAGRIIREYNGRLYIADGKTLWYTEPYSYDHVHRGRNFYQFADDITVMEPVNAGIYVVSAQTDLLKGNSPEDFTVDTLLNYGAIYGTSCTIPYDNSVLWYTDKGAILGTQSGEVKNLQEENVAPHTGTVGAGIVLERDGLRQLLVTVQNAAISPAAASSFIEMEVIRQGGAE